MHAGALIIIGIGYAGLCAFALAAFALAGRADDATDQALGDWPAIHPEMMGVAAARNNSGGGRSCKQAAAGEAHSRNQNTRPLIAPQERGQR